MSTKKNSLDYERMVEEALRGVVRDALTQVARYGLPGQHHFYITFDTQHEDVRIAAYLRERYPEEMTIVLQYQFWDLNVDEDVFAVSVSFNDVPERLVVPFAAVKGFADPAVKFGLQFHHLDEDELADDDDEAELPLKESKRETLKKEPKAKGKAKADKSDKGDRPDSDNEKPKSGKKAAAAATPSDDSEPTPPANVISIDKWRKK